MPSNFKALAGASGGEPNDPNFKNVTLLLHGDGSNGAQNNTFLDSSTNNFTITRNGNTTQGSFSPYGSNWSNYFDGTGDYLNVGNATLGSGDFTLEMWVFLTSLPNSQNALFSCGTSDTSSATIWYINSSGNLILYVSGNLATTSSTVPLNQWVHLAVVRSGTTVTNYINGVAGGTGTTSRDFSATPSQVFQGYGGISNSPIGYASNVRLVVGTALYTSTFTPSTTPLTAISGTSLLTCQSNRFRDASTNNFTITRNGDVKVTNFAPFAPTAAYSTSTNGGSAYFDGSGDYLSVAYNSALNVPGNFTVEAWIYQTSRPSDSSVINRSGIDFAQFSSFELVVLADGTVVFQQGSGTGTSGTQVVLMSATTIPLNTWTHIAGVRNGSTSTLYVNGVQAATGTSGSNDGNTSSSVFIGARGASSNLFRGYISNARLVKGTAVYTSNFTPPTTPLTAISGTSLLTNFTNAAIFDNSMKNDLETVGNAQISTSVKKFGTGSIYIPTGSLFIPNSQDLVFGSGNWTVEFWAYTDASGTKVYCDSLDAANTTIQMEIYSSGANLYWVKVGGSVAITANSALTANTWQHIAVTKSGSSTRLFVNGTQVGSTYTDTDSYNSARWEIGRVSGMFPLNGYLDDFRVTKGVARYTANFTPPTAAFPNK